MDGQSKSDVFSSNSPSTRHNELITEQFSLQAEIFARAPQLHNEAALALLVNAARPSTDDETLDVACGPGTVVAAFARKARRSVGLDLTAAMLDSAQKLARAEGLTNVEWRLGDVCALPFPDDSFDVVTCRFAFHHLDRPEQAFAEMTRVCRSGSGRVVLCDAMASDDPHKAANFNRMERLRDPSTVEFRTLQFLTSLFAGAGLPQPQADFFQIRFECDAHIADSFPSEGDREPIRRMIHESVDGDALGLNAQRVGDAVWISYPAVVLTAKKPAPITL
jgi:ubiquinone/menaquinone biosynthesis C-methylase UbiE